MIRRTYLGLDIRARELRGVALHRHGRGASLKNGRFLAMAEGTLAPALRGANVLDRQRFVEYVQEVLNPLAGPEERIGVSLPAAAGRLLVTDLEGSFRSHQEGIEIVKWQLKGSLPGEARDVQLDFQVLDRSESGRSRVLVSLMAREVLDEYEELLVAAGFGAELVDFHPLNMYNYYRPRLETTDDFVLVGIDQAALALLYFQGQNLSFFRGRDIAGDIGQVFQELTRTLAGLPRGLSGVQRVPVYVHSDWPEPAELLAAVGSAFGREATLLDPNLQRLTASPLELPEWRVRSLAAAIGVAERLL